MDFKATNEQLTPKQLNDLIAHLEKAIPNFPKLDGKTVSYDYEADIHVISFDWGPVYDSEDHGDYIIDLDSKGKIIGVELLNFKIDEELS